MVNTGSLDGNEQITQVVLSDRLADLSDGRVEAWLVVLNLGGRDQDAAVEIGEHPLGACLGTIDSHNAEVLGTGLLDAGMKRSGRLGDGQKTTRAACLGLDIGSHPNTSWERDVESPNHHKVVRMARREELFLSEKPHTRGHCSILPQGGQWAEETRMRQVSVETRPEDDVARDSYCARVSVRERRRKSKRGVA